jgi:hypothetical protein
VGAATPDEIERVCDLKSQGLQAREAFDPAMLPGCFNGVGVVVLADPVDGVVGFDVGEDGQGGDGGAGAAASTAAGDLEATAGERMLVGLAEKLRGAARVAGQPEVGPVDVVVSSGWGVVNSEVET